VYVMVASVVALVVLPARVRNTAIVPVFGRVILRSYASDPLPYR
jgi:hypothetical protein